MTTAPYAPTPTPASPGSAPPPGPGVQPPFPAPPTEGHSRRIGLGLGIGGAVVVLFCGGGLAAGIGLVSVMGKSVNEEAHKVVTDYFTDVQNKRYNQAYDQQCADVKRRESRAEFTSRVAASEPITQFSVGTVNLTDPDLAVPVRVQYDDGRSGTLYVNLGQDSQTGEFQVCGVEE